jgi:hypothetical protein
MVLKIKRMGICSLKFVAKDIVVAQNLNFELWNEDKLKILGIL